MFVEGAGEPILVRGVWLLFEARDEAFTQADVLLALALKTDDTVLAWELADPAPLRISPWTDSESSVEGCAASDTNDEESGLEPSRWVCVWVWLWLWLWVWAGVAVLESRSAASEALADLSRSRSRSFALSLAARGTLGKNCLYPALGAMIVANVGGRRCSGSDIDVRLPLPADHHLLR